MRPLVLFSLSALLLPTLANAHDASAEMAGAANNLLKSLSEEQKAKAVIDFDGKDRTDWHFVPKNRKGLPLKDMTQDQRHLAYGMLATGLSHQGFTKATAIMSLEGILAELEKGRGPARDGELYYFSIFGTPGKNPWGWRVEGHHLSLNFTLAGGLSLSMTPSFFGSNPGEVKEGPRAGTRPLAREEELARALVKALSEEQRKKAVILAEAPRDILNIPGRNATKAEGIPWGDLDEPQRAALMTLVKEYVGRHRPDAAAEDIARLEKSGLDKLHFAWAGGIESGQPHYYRVQSGSFVLEYDNVQNGANHVHSVWRDFDRDFGNDVLGEHIRKDHGGK